MNKTVLTFFAILCLLSIFLMTSSSVEAAPELLVHNLATGEDFATIQEAIDDNDTLSGHNILVDAPYGDPDNGIHIHKSVHLFGEAREECIINSNSTKQYAVRITASSVELRNFTITGYHSGILLDHSSHNHISKNDISGNGVNGIVCNYSSYSNIHDNEITAGSICVQFYFSNRNYLSNNQISGGFSYGVWFNSGSGNVVISNVISSANYYGVYFDGSNGNLLFGNTIESNTCNIGFSGDGSNGVFLNNILYGTSQVLDNEGIGVYDNGCGEGNYWSDYEGEDLDGDGIGDTNVPHYGDSHPLMSRTDSFSILKDGEMYYVIVYADATVSGLQYNQINETVGEIVFHIVGSGTTYCHVAVPGGLLDRDFNISVNGVPVEYGLCKRESPLDYRYLYFNVTLSTKEVVIEGIIPEFPSILVLPLFMIATLLTVMMYRKKQ